MEGQGKPRLKRADKVVHLYTQADRARKMAADCGSQLVAELFELHASLCERNAQTRQLKRPRR